MPQRTACHLESAASITSLPFVHTARRSYRLGVLVKRSDWWQQMATSAAVEKFVKPSHLEEGEVVTRFPLKYSLADVGCKRAGKSLGFTTPEARLSNCLKVLTMLLVPLAL